MTDFYITLIDFQIPLITNIFAQFSSQWRQTRSSTTTSDIVRKTDQYIKWKLRKNIGKIILLYLSMSLDFMPKSRSPGGSGIGTGGGGGDPLGHSGHPCMKFLFKHHSYTIKLFMLNTRCISVWLLPRISQAISRIWFLNKSRPSNLN